MDVKQYDESQEKNRKEKNYEQDDDKRAGIIRAYGNQPEQGIRIDQETRISNFAGWDQNPNSCGESP